LVPLPVLREIEIMFENDDAKLDQAFGDFETCSSIRRKLYMQIVFLICIIYVHVGSSDGCQTASEIYRCGLEKQPAVTNSLINNHKGNTTQVGLPQSIYALSLLNKLFLF
jgi:hypothetical protein